jgi:hypothetical protein
MPIGKKIDNIDWIVDPLLVKAFLQRLDDILDAQVDFDTTWVENVKEGVVKYNRYSLKQDWALKHIEEKIDAMHTAPPQDDDWIFRTDRSLFDIT